MKTRLLFITSLLLVMILTACTGVQATPVYMPDGPDRTAVLADSDVFLQHILKGIENKDFTTFSQDFDAAMLAAMKEADFIKLAEMYAPLGTATKVELQNVEIAGIYYPVNYKVTYPDKTLTIRVVVDQNNPRKVSGLWLK
jgi:hypothetical protein